MMMKAARYYGPGDIRIENVAIPLLKPDDVKIKVAWNGICGSDLHAYIAGLSKIPGTNTPGPLSGERLPITLGHEFSGTIVELGKDVDRKFSIGQNVCVEPVMACAKETCWPCLQGWRTLCPLVNSIGVGGWGGGLSEYICVPAHTVHVLPEGVSLEVGAFVEPLAVAWHAVKRSGYKKGDTALILGGGPIGLLLLKVLRVVDADSTVIVSEPSPLRMEYAKKCGATVVLNPLNEDLLALSLSMTMGKGVDHVYDAAGVQAGIEAGLRCVRPRGSVMLVALWEEPPKVDLNTIIRREIHLTGSICYDQVHPEVLEALQSGKISEIESLITSKIALEDVLEKGIEALLTEKDKQVFWRWTHATVSKRSVTEEEEKLTVSRGGDIASSWG
ncbi:hypothetical protein ONZ45_g16923 [Pleurotus djamor]|nr:hypothetical protein ONZ45_g16923 [Pleurotus djamor]